VQAGVGELAVARPATRTGGATPAAAAVAVACLAALTVAVVAPVPHGHDVLHVVVAVVVGAWAVAGAVTVASGARRLGWLVLAGAALGSAAALLARLAQRTTLTPPSTTHALATAAVVLLGAVVAHGVASLPDGALVARWRRALVATWYAIAAGTALWLAATHRTPSAAALAVGWGLATATVLPSTYGRYQRSTGALRQRFQWLGAGTVAALEVALAAGTLNLLVRWPSQVLSVAVAATVAIPLALLAAASGSLLARGGRAFVVALTVLGFTVAVSAIYLVLVLGLGERPSSTADREVLGLSMLAAAVVAVSYVPVRDRVLRSATGFVYGAKEAPDEVVRTFGSRLTRAIPMDELLLQLAESLRKTLSLASAELYTGSGEVLERAVSVPDRGDASLVVSGRERPVITAAGASGNAWAGVWLPQLVAGRAGGPLRVVPISHGGELLGLIVVERGVGANAFSEEDDRVLTELARQTGLAFHNAQLDTALQSSLDELRRQADELRASRARIVASGDAERRRVERDLHDGAQQHLVALAVNLRLAQDLVLDDPEGAKEMLGELTGAVQQTIQELRELAHGIYPPLLVDSGLPEALRAVCNRSPLDVDLVTDGVGRYGGDVEAAIYFCCLEALQNAGKHASDAHVVLRVWEDAGGLLFEVRDDGPGFDVQHAKRGHGFVNMSDRLGAIGGSVRWESAPGRGTTITGSVPIG
jgi:signal transduction histidine kinase